MDEKRLFRNTTQVQRHISAGEGRTRGCKNSILLNQRRLPTQIQAQHAEVSVVSSDLGDICIVSLFSVVQILCVVNVNVSAFSVGEENSGYSVLIFRSLCA